MLADGSRADEEVVNRGRQAANAPAASPPRVMVGSGGWVRVRVSASEPPPVVPPPQGNPLGSAATAQPPATVSSAVSGHTPALYLLVKSQAQHTHGHQYIWAVTDTFS
ncbi:hypothetical protein Q1695_014069 [Nippostrongylus brasiliensis]|nr:hypothetical protein Q1695_014069 [Nippostrongylus brasiliensis]